MTHEEIRVDVGSIDGAAVSITAGGGGGDRIVAQVTRWPDVTDGEWQYVVSALAAALNDGTGAASAIRAKARREVRAFVPDTTSSASRQHYIDTGRYLAEGEAIQAGEELLSDADAAVIAGADVCPDCGTVADVDGYCVDAGCTNVGKTVS